jgi:Tol biopolymer transport system component
MFSMSRRQLFPSTASMLSVSIFGSLPGTSVASAAREHVVQGDLRRLTEPGNGDNRATFMPHGDVLLFASNRSGKSQIWHIKRSGGSPIRFHQSAANDYGRPAPNSDGSRISLSSDRGGQNAVYVLDVASGAVTLISDPHYWSFGPSWSAHDFIAFFSKKGGNALNVWVVRPDGSQAQQVTDQPGESRQPWWSPDGDTLAISCDRGTGKFAIWLSRSDGSNAEPVTTNGNCAQPFWSPDGKKIAISAKFDEPQSRIYVMNADGSGLQAIQQPNGRDNVHPAWAPDGRTIVFTSGRGAGSSLYVFDGTF